MKKNIDNSLRKFRGVCVGAALGLALTATVALAAGSGSTHVRQNNQSSAIDIYNGYTGTLSVVVSTNGSGVDVTVDGLASQIAIAITNNIKWLTPQILAVTNRSGTAGLVVDNNMSLDSDTLRTNLLDGTYTALPGKWLSLLWNTTNSHLMNVYIPKGGPFYERDGDDIPARRTPVKYVVKSVFGQPSGTGNVTLSAYQNRTNLVFLKTFQRPYYENAPNTATGDTTSVVNQLVELDEDLGVVIGSQDSFFLRAERQTTSTAPGLIGLYIEQTP